MGGDAFILRVGGHTRVGSEKDDIETAIGTAKRRASQAGEVVHVIRLDDDVMIARVWPDGKTDLTFAGSAIA